MSPEFRAGERVIEIANLFPCAECGGDSHAYAEFLGQTGDEYLCEACSDGHAMDEDALPDGFEDDGQPSEYDEWQDYMGGDDWDHGQYDDVGYYDE